MLDFFWDFFIIWGAVALAYPTGLIIAHIISEIFDW